MFLKNGESCENIVCMLNACQIGKKKLYLLKKFAESKVARECHCNTRYEGHGKSTFLISFSPDCSKVATSHGDHTIKVFEVKTGKCVASLKGHSRTAWTLCYHPYHNNIIASGSLDGEIKVWDLLTGDSQSINVTSGHVISSLSFHYSDDILAVASSYKLYFLNWKTSNIIETLTTGRIQETIRLINICCLSNSMLTGILNDPDKTEQSFGDVGIHRDRTQGQAVQTVSCYRMDNQNAINAQPSSQTEDTNSLQEPTLQDDEQKPGVSSNNKETKNLQTSLKRKTSLQSGKQTEDLGHASCSSENENVIGTVVRPSAEGESQERKRKKIFHPPETEESENRQKIIASSNLNVEETHNLNINEDQAPVFDSSESHQFRDYREQCRPPTVIARTTSDSLLSSEIRKGKEEEASSSLKPHKSTDDSQTPNKCSTFSTMSPNTSFAEASSNALSKNEDRKKHKREEAKVERSLRQSVVTTDTELSSSKNNDTSVDKVVPVSNLPSSGVESLTYNPCNPNTRSCFSSTREKFERRVQRPMGNNLEMAAISSTSHTTSLLREDQSPSDISTQQDIARNTMNPQEDHQLSTDLPLQHEATHNRTSLLEGEQLPRDIPTQHDTVFRVERTTERTRQVASRLLSRGYTRLTDVSHSDMTSQRSSVSRPFRSQLWNVDLGPEEAEALSSQMTVSSSRLANDSDLSIEAGSTIPVYSFISYPSERRYSSSISGIEPSGRSVATATARTPRHVHTAVVIAGSNENESETALRTAINRAIAGAFAGNGEGAVAANIVNTTYRLQLWDLNDETVADLSQSEVNVLVPSCKLHNDGSIDVSQDESLLAAFVPSHQGFPENGNVCVYSMKKESFGQCIFRKSYGPNAVCLSISPLNQYVLVGLASRRVRLSASTDELMGQILKLPDQGSSSGEESTEKAVFNVLHPRKGHHGSPVSVNTAKFHPISGVGIIYGTNHGTVRHCRIGKRKLKRKSFIL